MPLLIIAILVIGALIFRGVCRDFVDNHSTAIKRMREINQSFKFHDIQNHIFNHSYDNEVSFMSVSEKDYLTYQLIYKKKEICEAIEQAKENAIKYKLYKEEVDKCTLGIFDSCKFNRFYVILEKIERGMFENLKKKPVTEFAVTVSLAQTNIRGRYLCSKSNRFLPDEIYSILERMSKRQGDFYLDEEIWQSICRVERARVSNKMRFSIYERDHYRCRKCGRRSDDLEIDHIFPISKGGKSNYENLQTLCHSCNALKSNTIEAGAVDPRAYKKNANVICKKCGAPMKLRKGSYGEFYGCTNYPKCKYTENVQ